MALLGGDLGAMAGLAARFNSAGGEFRTQTSSITTRVGDALQHFTDQMRILDREARTLAEEIDGEMKRLTTQAANTVWTGTNRAAHDRAVAAMDDDIVAIRAAIESFVTEASRVVDGALTTTMTSMKDEVAAAGAKAQGSAQGFSTSVTAQRAAFDRVMNG